VGFTKNEERNGASLVTILHKHSNIILYNRGALWMALGIMHYYC